MKEKYYEITWSLGLGIVFFALGIILLIGKEQMYQYLVNIMVLVLLGRTFLSLVRFMVTDRERKKGIHEFLSWIAHLIILVVFCFLPVLPLGILSFLFAIYLFMIGMSQLVMCFLAIRNGDFIRVGCLFLAIIYLGISFSILGSPFDKLDTFLVCLSGYIVLLGLSFLHYFLLHVLSIQTRNNLKRKIRITLPKIVEALIPYSVMVEINRNLAVEGPKKYSFEKDTRDSNLHILVHISNRGVNRIGHIDICYDGYVISYGAYDEGRRFCFDIFGDGVLFVVNDKSEYINFCIDNSKKTVFDFGIYLTKRQRKCVEKRIWELFDNTVSWDCRSDSKYFDGGSYAGKLYKRTGARFYKFKKGKYCTFFVLGTNCCFLVDDIIGKSGMDILSINGIITPGTYYDYLNRELRLKRSNVISKEIYNFDRRAGGMGK